MILGPNPKQHYVTGITTLEPGSILLLFTDGVIEHHMRDGSEFGIARLKSLVTHYANLSANQMISGIFEDLKLLNPNFHDDATIVCLKRIC